jgi:hypothetical protein
MNTNIFADMDRLLYQNEVVERHTFYQLKFFVIGSEPTNQAKMQCCLRELKTRRLSLENIQRETEELKDQRTLLNFELDRIAIADPVDSQGIDLCEIEEVEQFEKEREIEIRGLKRKIKNNERQMYDLQRKFKYVLEECQFFVSAFNDINEKEAIKPWDDLTVQQEYLDAKFGKELRTRIILGQPLDHELVKAIEELHDEANTKKQVMQLIVQQQQLQKKFGLDKPEIILDKQ